MNEINNFAYQWWLLVSRAIHNSVSGSLHILKDRIEEEHVEAIPKEYL